MDIYDYSNTLIFSFHYPLKKYHEINAVFEEIWQTIPVKGKKGKTILYMKKYLKYLICNMINAMYQEKHVVIPMNNKVIAKWKVLDTPKKKEYAKRVPWFSLIDALIEAGWIRKVSGFRAMTRQKVIKVVGSEIVIFPDQMVFYRKGCRTRISGTKKLHKILRAAKVYPEEMPSPLVILRKKNKKDKPEDIEFIDNDYTIRERSFLEELNKLYDDNDFKYIPDDEMKHYVNPYGFNKKAVYDIASRENLTKVQIDGVEVFYYPRDKRTQQRLFPRLCAIYNNETFYCGGRVYCKPLKGESYMNIYREDRHKIRINGKKTVEPDFSSLHISILYAMRGIQLDFDPYDLYPGNGAMRTIIKTLFLAMINSDSIESAIKAMKQTIYELQCQDVICERDLKFLIACNQFQQDWDKVNVPDWKQLIHGLEAWHYPIADYFCSGAGTKLQRMDSSIMKQVLSYFLKQGIPCLPVHDSVIIASQHEQELIEIMQGVYRSAMGYDCGVS